MITCFNLSNLSKIFRKYCKPLEKQQIVLSSTFSKFSNFPLYFGKVIILYVPFFIFTEKIIKGLKNLSRKTKSKQHTKNSKRVQLFRNLLILDWKKFNQGDQLQGLLPWR